MSEKEVCEIKKAMEEKIVARQAKVT